jgi:hypothetical protein
VPVAVPFAHAVLLRITGPALAVGAAAAVLGVFPGILPLVYVFTPMAFFTRKVTSRVYGSARCVLPGDLRNFVFFQSKSWFLRHQNID